MLEWDFAFNSTSADICIVPCALPFPTQSYRFCIFIITAIVTELQRICSSSNMTHMQMINPVHEVTSQQRKRRERKSGEKFGIMWAATARQNIWWDLKNPHGGEMKILVKPKSIYASILINKMFLLKYVWKKKAFFLLRLISGQELNSIFVIIFLLKHDGIYLFPTVRNVTQRLESGIEESVSPRSSTLTCQKYLDRPINIPQ